MHIAGKALLVTVVLRLLGAADGDTSREIWDLGFRAKRPPAIAPHEAKTAPKVAYKSSGLPPATAVKPMVGVSFFRVLAGSSGSRDAARLLVPETPSAKPAEYVLERLQPGAPLQLGDRVRVSIETPQVGYLYVIDRERHSDGTLGQPYLIFPALQFNGGDNRVAPGRLIEIPAQTDQIHWLNVSRRDPRHSGEELLIVVSEAPVPDLTPADAQTPVATAIVDRLLQTSAIASQRHDLISEAKFWTNSEKAAGGQAGRLLTQVDPMPQAIYTGEARPAKSLLVRIPLEVQ